MSIYLPEAQASAFATEAFEVTMVSKVATMASEVDKLATGASKADMQATVASKADMLATGASKAVCWNLKEQVVGEYIEEEASY